MPESKFPLLSILPLNLVPACSDCNQGKSASNPTTAEAQCLHPYFDHEHFIAEQWIYAEVRETTPATIIFFVKPSTTWDLIDQQRVKSHFEVFKISSRFTTQAINELATLKHLLEIDADIGGKEAVKTELQKRAYASE